MVAIVVRNDGRQVFDAESLSERLRRRASFETVAPVASVEVVELEKAIEGALDFVRLDVPGGSTVDTEALVEEGAVHSFDEAIGPWRAPQVEVPEILAQEFRKFWHHR